MKRFQVNRLSSLRRLWPRQCLACSADTGNAYLCTACRAALLPAGPQCQRCLEPPPPASGRAGPSPAPGECCAPLPPPWETAWVPWRYAWPLDRLVLGAKFGGRLAWARALGELLADHLPCGVADAILPVPLHPARLALRGFNQAQEIGAALAARHRMTLLVDGARRVRATPPQSTLDRSERLSNLLGAFIAAASRVRGRRILLVDDVVTTGATARALAEAALAAGARSVALAAVARA
jgi:ComF family protein